MWSTMLYVSNRVVICFCKSSGFNERVIWQCRREMKNDIHCNRCHQNQIYIYYFFLLLTSKCFCCSHLWKHSKLNSNWMRTICNPKFSTLSFAVIWRTFQFQLQMNIHSISLRHLISVRNTCNLYRQRSERVQALATDKKNCGKIPFNNGTQSFTVKWKLERKKNNATYSTQQW